MSVDSPQLRESTGNRAATIHLRMGNRDTFRRPVLKPRPAQAQRSPIQTRTIATGRDAEGSFATILAGVGRGGVGTARGPLAFKPVGHRSQLLGADLLRSSSGRVALKKGAEAVRTSVPMPIASSSSDDGERLAGVPFAETIAAAARKYGVSSELVAAVVKAESGFNTLARSRAGAKGLMQLMDGTARSLGVVNVFDPEQNIDGGVRFLSSLLERFDGDVKLALAGYNAGPGAVEKYGGIPPYQETRDYIAKVLDYWQEFARRSQAV